MLSQYDVAKKIYHNKLYGSFRNFEDKDSASKLIQSQVYLGERVFQTLRKMQMSDVGTTLFAEYAEMNKNMTAKKFIVFNPEHCDNIKQYKNRVI